MHRDPSLDQLLKLDGEIIVITDDGKYWVNFVVNQVAPTANRPHGLSYSLTLHGPRRKRIAGFDNAHPVPPKKWTDAFDHRHFDKNVKPYEYADAVALLIDFWALVDRVLDKKGVKR
jgi:hypothetical protein